MTAHELFRSLRSIGLVSHLSPDAFATAARRAAADYDGPLEDPFVVMRLLDDAYGFDTDDESTATARSVADRALVFNEIHEVGREDGVPRLEALAAALGSTFTPPPADEADPDLLFETVDDLVDALQEGLMGTSLKVFAFGVDTWDGVVVRETLPDDALPHVNDCSRSAPAAEAHPPPVKRPWWKFW